MDFIKLKEICDFEKGSTGLAKAESGGYPLVATGADRKTCNAYQFDTKAVCIPLVSSTGHGHASLKNVHYQEGKFALGTILVALTSKDENRLNIQFLHLYLSQLKDLILVPLMSGAANVALSVKKIQNVEIPLPPIERQREIVENFKSIVIEENELKSELTQQQTLLKKLRQQILQEAIEGKLTADWRRQNPNIEPTSKLLERIAAEKAQLIKEKKIKKQKPLPPISEEEKPFELPEGWEWCRLGELFEFIDYRGKTPKKLSAGIRLITARNVKSGVLSLNAEDYISKEEYKERMTRGFPKSGDLLFTTEAPLGNICLLNIEDKEISTGQRLITLQNYWPIIDNKLFMFFILSPFYQEFLVNNSTGVTAKGIKASKLKNLPIPFPMLSEQKAIATKVDKLLTLCDQLETQITQNQTHAKQLMQAVLKEAFQSEQPTKRSQPDTSKPVKTKNRDNVILLKPTRADYYKRMLLAAEIVHQLHQQPTLGHLKLQKLIYLCQKTEQMQLPTNFLQQAAGPYDPKMARSLDKQLKDKKWFIYQREEALKYAPLENAGEHRADFDKYFAQQKEGIHMLINLFRKAKSDQMEIVATLYACWERLLHEGSKISNDMLMERFYQWSEAKSKYTPERLKTAIEWMVVQGIIPSRKTV